MNTKKFLIAGSILSADLLNLEKDVKEALDEGVDVIHFDVMDYHFVPNMTFGPCIAWKPVLLNISANYSI